MSRPLEPRPGRHADDAPTIIMAPIPPSFAATFTMDGAAPSEYLEIATAETQFIPRITAPIKEDLPERVGRHPAPGQIMGDSLPPHTQQPDRVRDQHPSGTISGHSLATPTASPADPAQQQTARKSAGVLRAGSLMAVAAVASRLTGFVVKIVIAAAIGFGVINDSYSLANTLPNIVFELLIGGVLTSVAIPLLTRAQRTDPDGGLEYTQRLMTLALAGLLTATVLAVAAAPLLTRLYLSDGSGADPELATSLAYLLLPQIFFYGMAALFGAILNTKERFGAPAWAPVVNNLLVIGVGIAIMVLPGGINSSGAKELSSTQFLVLGVGTTLGIIAQAAILLPSLRTSGFRFKLRFGWDKRIGEAGALAGWAVAYVLVSQIGYIVLTNLLSDDNGGLSSFATASLLFQMPYGILGVSILTAVMPRMSRHAAAGDMIAVKDDVSLAHRLSTVALLPITAVFLALGAAVGVVTFGMKADNFDAAIRIGITCGALALGLLPLAMSLIQMRVFYAMKDGRTPVIINAIMVAVRIPLLILASNLDGNALLPGLALATAASYLVGAVVGELWLRARFGPMGTPRVLITIGKMFFASVIGGGAAWVVVHQLWDGTPERYLEALLQLALGGFIGLGVTFAVALLVRVREFAPVTAKILRLIGRGAQIATDPGSVTLSASTPQVAAAVSDVPLIGAASQRYPAPQSHPTQQSIPTREQVTNTVSGDGSTTGAQDPALNSPTLAVTPGTPTASDQAASIPSPANAATGNSSAGNSSASNSSAGNSSASNSSPSHAAPDNAPPSRPRATTPRHTAVESGEPPTALTPGSMIGGRYRLVNLVAVDASGHRFWRAKDTVLPRDMAITLLPEGPNTSATVARTLRAGRLHHIGLPQTLDLGTERGQSYVVGQWVDGATLTDLLAGGPLEGEVASSITAKIADAVAEAHRNGISLGAIHPSLVRVNFDGQVRLSHVIAHAGATPDQDIRAIGGLLYLMLTGTWPLPQSGMSPPLPPAPTSGGRELPASDVRAGAPAALAALAERTLHPEGQHGVRSPGAIAALLHGTTTPEQSRAAENALPATAVSTADVAERRLRNERRIKLSVAGLMLLALTVLLAIVVSSVVKQAVASVEDPIPLDSPVNEAQSNTGVPTTAGEPSTISSESVTTDVTSAEAPTTAAVAAPVPVAVPIIRGQVYDPQGDGNKDYTALVDRAWDGDPTTSWKTYSYKQNFAPPPAFKQGVGLLIELDRAVSPSQVIVTVPPRQGGIKVAIIASDGNVNLPLAKQQVLATSDVGDSPAAINLTGAPSSKFLIVQIVGLIGSAGDFQGQLGEIQVLAPPAG